MLVCGYDAVLARHDQVRKAGGLLWGKYLSDTTAWAIVDPKPFLEGTDVELWPRRVAAPEPLQACDPMHRGPYLERLPRAAQIAVAGSARMSREKQITLFRLW